MNPLSSRVCTRAAITPHERQMLRTLHDLHGEDWFALSVAAIATICGIGPDSARRSVRRLQGLLVLLTRQSAPQDPTWRRIDLGHILVLAAQKPVEPTIIYRRSRR